MSTLAPDLVLLGSQANLHGPAGARDLGGFTTRGQRIDSDTCKLLTVPHSGGIADSPSCGTSMLGTPVRCPDYTRVRNVETVPDLTCEIYNKTLVASNGYCLHLRAYRKKSQGSPTKVAVKIFRVVRGEILKALKRELRVWKSLNHRNIVPLLGLVSEKLGPGLVTPWYSNGNILQYLRRVPNVKREPLCEDVARGLRYLHEQDLPIIHGDIRGTNILVAMDGRAVLCDFGLARILDSGPTGFPSFTIGCTLRFKAPEEFANDLEGGSIPTDVYSYACIYAQIMTGEPPFHWHRTDPPIMRAICRGELPYRIDSIVSRHDLGFLGPSWDADPACRPTMSHICRILGIPDDAP
ncbi:hypothetical protein BS47DRAFT_1355718 [Hydnum rufescens UP504]|uniref:Protein kinase domain-containing protein n=1 Tax=Hydnum rufescens UP504 TaxID=1448309 RepID=A0A9P6ADJ5_9AGAM|nr:hypothetical protein BS47DRAFT_1355718 [Hydnum rufescens UP504]